jgi:hypothetical protein
MLLIGEEIFAFILQTRSTTLRLGIFRNFDKVKQRPNQQTL